MKQAIEKEQQGQLAHAASGGPLRVDTQAPLAQAIGAAPRMAAQRELGVLVARSPRMTAQRKLSELVAHSPRMAAQREGGAAPAASPVAQRKAVHARGLPAPLKSGIESLSGMSMDHVNVHYNSGQPARLNALAYAQGSDIHLAPGQERHLPHEAWHVVQQAQGRVRPTLQMKQGVAINDDEGLEREADVMGVRAMSQPAAATVAQGYRQVVARVQPRAASPVAGQAVQRLVRIRGRDDLRGQNSIRIWMLKRHVAENYPGNGILAAYAPAIRALLVDDDKKILVDDSDAGAEQLFRYLVDYRYARPQGGDNANQAWRRRIVNELLEGNYPLVVLRDLIDQELNIAGLLPKLNRAVDAATGAVMNYPDFRPRGGMTLDQGWERRRVEVVARLADAIYDQIVEILGPEAGKRVALATEWSGSNDDVLKDLGAMFRTEPRAAAATDVTDGGLSPDDYADGSSDDPIPFLFYKRPNQYPATIVHKASSAAPDLKWDVANNLELYDGDHAVIGGANIFAPIQKGKVLKDNSNHGSKRPVEVKIRKSLALDYNLAGLDIDHILDLGFGGADTGENLWPLNSDVNRRPVTGQWRTQYKLHFKHGDRVMLGAISSANLYHKYFRIKDFVPGTGAYGVPQESGKPEAGKKT